MKERDGLIRRNGKENSTWLTDKDNPQREGRRAQESDEGRNTHVGTSKTYSAKENAMAREREKNRR